MEVSTGPAGVCDPRAAGVSARRHRGTRAGPPGPRRRGGTRVGGAAGSVELGLAPGAEPARAGARLAY